MLKRLVLVVSLVVGLSLVAPATNAMARSGGEGGGSWSSWSWSSFSWSRLRAWWSSITSPSYSTPTSGGSAGSVPELDPSAAGSALVLLIGGVAYLTSRRREEEEQA